MGRRRHRRGGFTLLEALVAVSILLGTVTAVAMALSTGRQYALEAQDQMQATLAAESLLAEILAAQYADLTKYDGHEEEPGTMQTPGAAVYPESFYRIGRRVAVVPVTHDFPDLGVQVDGQEIAVEAYDLSGRVLCTLSRFVPEPN